MKITMNPDETFNIEDLSPKKLALIERLLHQAGRDGGYKIDIDEYNDMLNAFASQNIDVKSIFDLDKEKADIEERIRQIMAKYK